MELIVNLRPDLGSSTSTASLGLHRITDYIRHELVKTGLRGRHCARKVLIKLVDLVLIMTFCCTVHSAVLTA